LAQSYGKAYEKLQDLVYMHPFWNNIFHRSRNWSSFHI